MTVEPTPPTPPATPTTTVPDPHARRGSGRARALALLAGAIVCETGGTAALQASAGFGRPVPALGALLGYVLTIALFSRALAHGLALGVAYATVTGCGLLAATLVGALLAEASPTASQAVGLLAILGGTLALQVRPRRVLP